MKQTNFFKRYWPALLGSILAITGAVFFMKSIKDDDPPPPPDRSCYSTTDENLNTLFAAGWNEPGNPNYIQTLIFQEDVSGSAGAILITPKFYNAETKRCETSRQGPIVIRPSGECNLGSWENFESYYNLEATDVDPSGRFAYSKLDIVPRASPINPRYLAFEIDFYRGGTYEKTDVTRPCPPFCPTPD